MSVTEAEDFATRLNELRAEAGLSEAEMCAWLGDVPKSTLGSWSRGDRKPHWFVLERLRKALAFLAKELRSRNAQFPIPLKVRQNDRLEYVRTVRANYPAV